MDTLLKKKQRRENETNIIPKHVGFILDGNRRWAKQKGLPSLEGHRKGLYQALIPTIENCQKRGIKYITLFCFSTENWNRSKEEVNYLMLLFEQIISEKLNDLKEKNVKVNFIGRIEDFSEKIQKLALKAVEQTKENDGITLNMALSYGGRAEIVDATKKIVEAGYKPEDITEELFSKYIYENNQPDPDLIIRTSGEQRLSGFMLWQSSYSELYFTKTFWPDFDEKELDIALNDFANRKRRFGA